MLLSKISCRDTISYSVSSQRKPYSESDFSGHFIRVFSALLSSKAQTGTRFELSAEQVRLPGAQDSPEVPVDALYLKYWFPFSVLISSNFVKCFRFISLQPTSNRTANNRNAAMPQVILFFDTNISPTYEAWLDCFNRIYTKYKV